MMFQHGVVRDGANQIQQPSTRAVLHSHALAILENQAGTNLAAIGLELGSHAKEAQLGGL